MGFFLFGKFEVQQHPVGLSACSSQSSTNTVGLVHPWAGVVKWPTSVVKKHPNHRFSLSEIMFFFFFCTFFEEFSSALFNNTSIWALFVSDISRVNFISIWWDFMSSRTWVRWLHLGELLGLVFHHWTIFFGAWHDGSCDGHFPWSWVIGAAFSTWKPVDFFVLQDISCFNGICSIPDLGLESEEVVISAESGQLDESKSESWRPLGFGICWNFLEFGNHLITAY